MLVSAGEIFVYRTLFIFEDGFLRTTYQSVTFLINRDARVRRLFNNETRSPKELLVNNPGGEAKWAIDPRPLKAKGLIVLVSSN